MPVLLRLPPDKDIAQAVLRGKVGVSLMRDSRITSVQFADDSGRASGEIDPADIPRLVKAVRDGEHLPLIVDALSYRQGVEPGNPNRNGMRVAASALEATAASGIGTVFLHDHAWDKGAERGGTVIHSALDTEGAEQLVKQRFHLVYPWAIESALLSTLDRLSVGMLATGGWQCTVCHDDPWKCWHFPLEEVTDDDGVTHTVEWEARAAQLVETSYVNVPAVLGTEVGLPSLVRNGAPSSSSTVRPSAPAARSSAERNPMDEKEKTEFQARIAALTADLAAANKRADDAAAQLQAERRQVREREAKAFVDGLVAEGRLSSASTAMGQHLVSVYVDDPEKARTVAADLHAGPDLSAPQRAAAVTHGYTPATASASASASASPPPSPAVPANGPVLNIPRGDDGKVNFDALVNELPQAIAADIRTRKAQYGSSISARAIVLASLDSIQQQLTNYGLALPPLKAGEDY